MSQAVILGTWQIMQQPDGRWHVTPIDDNKDHLYGAGACPCNPEVTGPMGTQVVHNAFDKRELRETKMRASSPART